MSRARKGEFALERPDKPALVRLSREWVGGDVFYPGYFGAAFVLATIAGLAGGTIGLIPDALGVGGMGIEEEGVPIAEIVCAIIGPVVVLSVFLGAAVAMLYGRVRYPDLTFPSNSKMLAYKSYNELDADDREDAAIAYQAVLGAEAGSKTEDEAYKVFKATLVALEKRRKDAINAAGYPMLEEARARLKNLEEINEG